MTTPRVLFVGYNSANDTGAEALLLTDIEDLLVREDGLIALVEPSSPCAPMSWRQATSEEGSRPVETQGSQDDGQIK